MSARRSTTPRALAGALALGAALAGTAAAALPASAASAPVAVWQMNEAAGATVMADSSGHGINGTIGSEVQTHTVVGSRVAYAFPYLKNGVPPTHPQHLVRVPADPRLNPGTADFAVTMTLRFKPGANGGNVLQKGQASSPGGYFKLEIDRGGVSCLFRGASGSGAVGTGVISDNVFHTIRCARTATGVTMTVDGRQTASRTVRTGSISNAAVLTIGGKPSCNQTTVQCDYFSGTIDGVQIDAG